MTEEEKAKVMEMADQIRHLSGLKKTLRRNFNDMLGLLTSTISLSNTFLGGHIKRVAILSKTFAEYIRLDKNEVFLTYYGALMHDIGMVGMPSDLITSTPAGYDDHQLDLYHKHPVIGEKLISSAYDLKQTAALIRSHHEDYSGDGFPDGLAGNAIPLGARIIRLANDYDNYLYKSKIKANEAAVKISEQAGYVYDPRLAPEFIKFIKVNIDRQDDTSKKKTIPISELKEGMYISDDICLQNGLLLIPKGVIIDAPMLERVFSFESLIDMERIISVVY